LPRAPLPRRRRALPRSHGVFSRPRSAGHRAQHAQVRLARPRRRLDARAMTKARSLVVALAVALAALVAGHSEARACAPAPPEGVEVSILAEQAVIVWDEAAKTQHFIRRADFSTEARSFGFLVPTPTKPTLESAPDAIFRAL